MHVNRIRRDDTTQRAQRAQRNDETMHDMKQIDNMLQFATIRARARYDVIETIDAYINDDATQRDMMCACDALREIYMHDKNMSRHDSQILRVMSCIDFFDIDDDDIETLYHICACVC